MPKKNAGYRLQWRAERDVWEIIWYEQGKRKRVSTRTRHRKEADQVLKSHIERSQRRAVSRLVDDVLADYQIEHAPHTAKPIDIAHCVLNLLPFFGEKSVEQITKASCQEFTLRRKKEGLSNATIRKDLETLRAALNHDFKEKRIAAVPYIWMPDKPQPKERWLTRQECARLVWAARKSSWYLPWFILISLYTGQRLRSVLNLTWDRVDLENGTINWQYGRATNKRRPKQPMPDELKMFLRYLKRRGTKNGYVLHIDQEPIKNIKRGLKTSMRNAGIENASAHTLKHTALTHMMQNGTNIWSVAGFSGTSIKTIEGTYGHHHPDYLEDARTSAKQARRKRAYAAPNAAPRNNIERRNLYASH